MLQIDATWLASSAGVLALVEITVTLLKPLLKAGGDIWLNVATILFSVIYCVLAAAYLGTLSTAELYPLIGQIVIVAGTATLGYEVVSNIRRKQG